MLNVVKESAQRAKKILMSKTFVKIMKEKFNFTEFLYTYAQDLYLDNQEIRRKSKDRNEKNYAMNGI